MAESSTIRDWICSTLDSDVPRERAPASPTVLLPMGVAARGKLWTDRDIRALTVGFLGGTQALQDRVLRAAQAWCDGTGLTMARAEKAERGHIRVAFQPGLGSWSYIGTDCLGIQRSQPTMNLGWVDETTPEDDFTSVVQHEFGHALGLLHEHQHPDEKIGWDEAAVIADLSGPPNYWDDRTIRSNVFERFDANSVITTSFNAVSIMIYPVPGRWTLSGKGFMPSSRLSDGDRATIRRLYP